MRRYPPIADHGIVGDLQTAALISAEGVVDWFCAPRFDSPSMFAALLDHDRGGHFAITVAGEPDEVTVRQLYLPDTGILVTRFLTLGGIAELVDFMPPQDPERASDRHRLIRVVRVVRGSVDFTLECRPRFDYGRAEHRATLEEGRVRFEAPAASAWLESIGPVPLACEEGDATAAFTLRHGELAAVVLTTGAAGSAAPEPMDEATARATFALTLDFWREWIGRCRYRGRWQQMVNRSAITLKLLTYAPTGAMVAAATAGLPEQVGGERNWDYRFTWIRDASLSVGALIELGYDDEANAFRRWVGERIRAGDAPPGEKLQIMYRVDGDPRLSEEELGHLEGYRGSFPVRVGNGAADQLQLDIYGEAVYALAQAEHLSGLAGHDGWMVMAGLLDWLCDHWDRPDEGIWETRGGRQDFTYSRVMCWTALHHGIRIATRFARPADLARWTAARDAILLQVMERGWSDERRAFVQHYRTDVLDASLLLMPKVGFVAAREPRWLSTLDAMDQELVTDSLVHRYDPAASPDGLRGSEGTFSLCSFLYVDALARAGRLDQARYAFDKMLTYANHVGLYAEEIGPTGEQLGNFPQAFTHLALIDAALALDAELDARGGPGGG
ncbi:glycoside hydrolase family 15 protein [Streptacidiphilus rugosus]|uniref:glycoside hydrolase family 15 protein n=1 Tax=Streptacidiphilus rugosus TaxID=405783 RepID=UPI000566788B|nr:glycoside hydrolase family 15 protein [Streptacidiphilus rugosus]